MLFSHRQKKSRNRTLDCNSCTESERKIWRNIKGIILEKGDEPKAMQKKVREQNILKTKIALEENSVRAKYMLNHPVVQLLEKNSKKIHLNELFFNEKRFAILKNFKGMSAYSCSIPHTKIFDEIKWLNTDNNIRMIPKFPAIPLNENKNKQK